MGICSKPKAPKPAPASEGEIQDRELGKQINLLNLRQSGYEAIWDPEKQTYSFREMPLTPEQIEQEARDKELNDMIYNRLRGVADPETKRLVGETFQAQREAGNQELNRYMTEMAGARGLDITDSPFQRELGIQKQGLETGLRGAEAASLLDVGNRQQIFAQQLREFSAGLNQQAMMNRMAMGQAATGSALTQMGNRYGIAGRTSGASSGADTLFKGMGATGGLLSGLGAAGSMLSSREFKEEITPVDLDAIMAEIEATPVYSWRYKGDSRTHIGPVTEEAPKGIVSDDGKMLVSIDYMGFMLGAIKALSQRVKQLEAR